MSDATVVLLVLATGTYVLKAAGPLVLGGRTLPASVQQTVDLLPAALLALSVQALFEAVERRLLPRGLVLAAETLR